MAIREIEGSLSIISPAIYIIFAFTIFLSSCARSGDSPGNYIYAISKGDKFVLKKDIAITTRDKHVYLQNGEIKFYANVDKYAPFCRFAVSQEGTHTIRPVSMRVTKAAIYQSLENDFNYYVKFDVRAPNNPSITSLTCGAWGSFSDTHITFTQMQQALGNYFEIPEPK
ncbi:MAG: hypothetical protein OEU74_02905 [Gammaproteobacteria bacterium]|nr:hypothetical protein [Gammaproteobacteria bacterium]